MNKNTLKYLLITFLKPNSARSPFFTSVGSLRSILSRQNGIITFTYANLQSAKTEKPDYDFEVLEKLIEEYGYDVIEKVETEDIGYKWINYKIKLKK